MIYIFFLLISLLYELGHLFKEMKKLYSITTVQGNVQITPSFSTLHFLGSWGDLKMKMT